MILLGFNYRVLCILVKVPCSHLSCNRLFITLYPMSKSHVSVFQNVDKYIESEVPQVTMLTIIFFALNFLAATQDIAVDGWALTMLSKHNRGYASTCNSVGQTAGYFIGNVVFLALNSRDFSNAYLRSKPSEVGAVTLAQFLWFWGLVFLVTTTLVLIFKKESTVEHDDDDLGVFETYFVLSKIIKLPAVIQFVIVLLTVRVSIVFCFIYFHMHIPLWESEPNMDDNRKKAKSEIKVE